MQLYHNDCPGRTRLGEVARFRLHIQNVMMSTRVYKCEKCGALIHIDMDWEEGAVPEQNARLD